MTTLAVRLAPPRSRAVARAGYQVTCAVVGSFLIAGLAQISVHLPFTPVPITGQTLGVLLVGASFGPGLGAATAGLYLCWALVGLPVLAPNPDGTHDAGRAILTLSPAGVTGGYLLGFVAASALVGWLARRGWDRSFRSAIGAMLLGEVVIFSLGVAWLMAALDVGVRKALVFGLYPFVVGDLLKLLSAAALLPGAHRLLDRFRPEGT